MNSGKETIGLIAGGAGFIGSHLVDALLARGWRVICIDNFQTGRFSNLRHLEREPRVDVIDADIIDPLSAKLTRGRCISFVFNLACAASPPHYQADPEHTLLTNILGTRNLLQLAEVMEARFLLTSTSEVYGDPETHPQRESYWGHVNPTGPRACYDEGKRAAETLTFDYYRAGRADVRVARIFNTYGPRMRADDGRVVSNMITQALAGDVITIYGNGDQTRSFCYVDDLIEGILRLAAHDYLGAVNLGNPHELRVRDLADLVVTLTGTHSAITFHPLPVDDPRRRRPDISLAREVLGWAPRVALEAGLKKTIEHFMNDALAAAELNLAARAGKSRPRKGRAWATPPGALTHL
jgi:UDP-glucuronate decarboxylase